MRPPPRWDPCISHRGADVKVFLNEYFLKGNKSILLIAGAGFDPRSSAVLQLFKEVGIPLRVIFIREERPNPHPELVKRAAENFQKLSSAYPSNQVVQIEIFGPDNSVIGGRNAVKEINKIEFKGLTDIVVDMSALSIGISFPIISYFVEKNAVNGFPSNLHVFVSHEPNLDDAIQPLTGDSPGFIHGFRGNWSLESTAKAAKLWMPQLGKGREGTLRRLFDFLEPHDTCPILPFPASNPRLADEIAEHYMQEFENSWKVDGRNIVHAALDDPLDLYRTILRMDNRRAPVFAEVGGSLVVLSPVGSKIMSLGALMAALERDLPIAYIEAIGYNFQGGVVSESSSAEIIHVWLEGEAYPATRPRCKA